MKCTVVEPFAGHERGEQLDGEQAETALRERPANVVRIDEAESPHPDNGD